MLLQRYVIVVGTAFAGAWMVIVGAVALAASAPGRGAVRAATSDVWIMYPLTPRPVSHGSSVAWVALGLIAKVTGTHCRDAESALSI